MGCQGSACDRLRLTGGLRALALGSYIVSLRWRGTALPAPFLYRLWRRKLHNRPAGVGNGFPLWWLAPPPCPVGSVSLDSQSPTAPCESSSLATPASGGTITRAYCRVAYEERSRGVLFCPLHRGKSGAAGRGEASAASQSAECLSCHMTQKDEPVTLTL